MTITANFKRFSIKLEYGFLNESTKIKNASFPYKTTISEANGKTNRMSSTKRTYHEERSFSSNYLIFLEIFLSLKTSYKDLIRITNDPSNYLCTFCKSWSFIWRCFFSVSILKTLLKIWGILQRDVSEFIRIYSFNSKQTFEQFFKFKPYLAYYCTDIRFKLMQTVYKNAKKAFILLAE